MKMKNLLILSLGVSFAFSCSHFKKNTLCENVLIPKENIKILLDSFVLQNKNSAYLYELYIDKQGPDNCDLLLYAGEKSLTEKENEARQQAPIASFMTQGVRIFIYSGVERYFTNQQTECNTEKIKSKGNNEIMWAIKDSCGSLTSYKIDGGYPFISFPRKIEPGLLNPPIVNPD